MRKKYISPLFAELELVLEDVLFSSEEDNDWNDADDPDYSGEFDNDEFDQEEDFDF